ncbi:MAG: 4-hydroxy-3-methylbut-2-enyl diphosphate reductase [Chitinispirillales bacterium]|jgi:4-hydroxy-3-methylbut-2-enyl diphosphate reductase|nr:4-hydroxy-3-methylbut-2-enyl diphosphate reductase [Chitinispirillales bacterium]
MKIIVAQAAGFCMGVKRAVDQALMLSNDKSSTTWTLGPLIHNRQTIEMLEQRGVHVLNETDPPPAPTTLLIRAHGVPPEVMDQYKSIGYKIVDGTCPKVKTVHKVIERHRAQGYDIIITGDEGHAEVIGLLGYAGDHGYLIQTVDDINSLPRFEKICLVSQTTFDRVLFDDIAEKIKAKFGDCDIVVKKTICSATDQRQEETEKLARSVDAVIVVGGRNSANTQRLAQIAQTCGTHTQAIETEDEIEWEPLAECKTIGVTAGASTPNWMIKRVCDHLQFLSRTKEKKASGAFMRALDRMANLNLFVSTGAVAAYYVSCVMQGIDFPQLGDTIALGGAIAFFYFVSAYLWNSLASLESTLHLDISKYRFYHKYPKRLFFLSGASIVAVLITAFLINKQTFYLMFLASVAGSAYHITIVPKQLRKFLPYKSLKDIPASRDLSVALAWAIILTFLPQTIAGTLTTNMINVTSLTVFAMIFMLSFLRSLIFDLRDIEGDRIMGRETLITIVGETRARNTIYIVILGCVGLILASPAILGAMAYEYAGTLRFWSQIPALIYAAVFVRINAGIRSNHTALFCLLADGLFYLAAFGAFLSTVSARAFI